MFAISVTAYHAQYRESEQQQAQVDSTISSDKHTFREMASRLRYASVKNCELIFKSGRRSSDTKNDTQIAQTTQRATALSITLKSYLVCSSRATAGSTRAIAVNNCSADFIARTLSVLSIDITNLKRFLSTRRERLTAALRSGPCWPFQ